MKQIFILLLAFFLFSCSKDEKSNTLSSQKSEQDVFNAVVGTWNFNRLAYDAEFKQVKEIEIKECAVKDYTIMKKDSTIIRVNGCYNEEDVGTFYIEFGGSFDGDTDVHFRCKKSGLSLTPGVRYDGGVLYSYTDSTLVFSGVTHYSDTGDTPNLYSELKRVK